MTRLSALIELRSPLEFARRRPLAIASGLILIFLFIQALLKRSSEWTPVYVAAAQRLLNGQDIFEGTQYAYPPFMAMLVIPFTFLPPQASRVLYAVISALCMIGMVRAAWHAAGGPPIDGSQPWGRREWGILLFGLLCGGPYILLTFHSQQTDLLIGFFLIYGCLQLMNGGQASGGALIGLAAACKVTPLLFCPYLFFRRQWLAGAMVGTVALAVNLVPNLISTPPQGGLWLTRWVSLHVVQEPEQTLGAIGGRMVAWGNLSLSGTTHRLINSKLEFSSGELQMVSRPVVGKPVIVAIFGALASVILAVSLIALLRAPARGRVLLSPDPLAVEYAMLICLMLLLSPMSSAAHFGILVLPGFCLARLAFATQDRMLWFALTVAGVLFAITNKGLVGGTIYTVLTWVGSTMIGTVLLWWACVWALLRTYRRSVPEPAGVG